MARSLSSWDDYEQFVNRVEKWYNRNSKRYMRYMSQYGRDIITEVEFKAVMRDLTVPFSDVEVHILYSWLDLDVTGKLEYHRLYEAVFKALYERFAVDDDLTRMNIEYDEKWIRMTFKSPTCDPLEMPTTFEALIDLGYTGAMLTEMIRERVPNLATRNLVIFSDQGRYSETLIRCNQRLYESEYTGGPRCAPTEGTLYYEFSMGHVDCPLLLDFWVGKSDKNADADGTGQNDAASPALKDQSSSN